MWTKQFSSNHGKAGSWEERFFHQPKTDDSWCCDKTAHPQRTGKMEENRLQEHIRKTICWLHVAVTGPENQIKESLKCSQQSVFNLDVLHVPVQSAWKCQNTRKVAPLLSQIFPFYPKSWKIPMIQGGSTEQSSKMTIF